MIPCSKISYDLYWIAVHSSQRGKGYGKHLLKLTEEYIKKLGGIQIILDTSSTEQYSPTRHFYESSGYEKATMIPDFYDYGDGKVIYVKRI